jgi:hypothetical protein
LRKQVQTQKMVRPHLDGFQETMRRIGETRKIPAWRNICEDVSAALRCELVNGGAVPLSVVRDRLQKYGAKGQWLCRLVQVDTGAHSCRLIRLYGNVCYIGITDFNICRTDSLKAILTTS